LKPDFIGGLLGSCSALATSSLPKEKACQENGKLIGKAD
jgi:hypothetical protein